MSPDSADPSRPLRRALGLRLPFLVLVVLPMGLAGVAGHLIGVRHAQTLVAQEAGRMARSALSLTEDEGSDAALRALEGIVGFELALYRDGARFASSDRGFGPDTLDAAIRTRLELEDRPVALELEGRRGALARDDRLAALAARSSPRAPERTYPGGLLTVGGLALAVALVGLGLLPRERAPSGVRTALLAVVPVGITWLLLVAAGARASEDAERSSAREVGLGAALARDLGLGTPATRLARLTGLRVASLPEGGGWDAAPRSMDSLRDRVEGLPRPPLDRTITGYVSSADGRMRYAASRWSGGTVVFLAPAPDLPPPAPGLRLLLLGLGVAGAAAVFALAARRRSLTSDPSHGAPEP